MVVKVSTACLTSTNVKLQSVIIFNVYKQRDVLSLNCSKEHLATLIRYFLLWKFETRVVFCFCFLFFLYFNSAQYLMTSKLLRAVFWLVTLSPGSLCSPLPSCNEHFQCGVETQTPRNMKTTITTFSLPSRKRILSQRSGRD